MLIVYHNQKQLKDFVLITGFVEKWVSTKFWWDNDCGLQKYLQEASGHSQLIKEKTETRTTERKPHIVVNDNAPDSHEEALLCVVEPFVWVSQYYGEGAAAVAVFGGLLRKDVGFCVLVVCSRYAVSYDCIWRSLCSYAVISQYKSRCTSDLCGCLRSNRWLSCYKSYGCRGICPCFGWRLSEDIAKWKLYKKQSLGI